MFLKLDRQKMEVIAWCGIVENYKPTKEIKQIHKKVEILNQKMKQFMEEITPELNNIEVLIDKENQKHVTKKE